MIADPAFNRQFSQFCFTFNSHAALTTYLDTPILPISAFAGPNNWQLDCEYPDFTPVVHSVSVEFNGKGGGPYVVASGTAIQRRITITSVETVDVLDPNAERLDGQNATMISRDFGFGADEGLATINGQPLTIISWENGVIVATVPASASTGQLVVTRRDGAGELARSTVNAATVIVNDGSIPDQDVVAVAPGGSIQDAIDDTPAGGVVLIAPGTYPGALIVTQPIQIHGWGAPSTILAAVPSPESTQLWREKVNFLANCVNEIGLLPGQTNNSPNVAAECGFTPGSGLFVTEEQPGVLVAPQDGVFQRHRQRTNRRPHHYRHL